MAALPVLTVTELNSQIQFQLSSSFPQVYVCGEISGFSQPKSGHCYFTLKDAESQIRAVIWKTNYASIKQCKTVELLDGVSVICGGSISVYSARGEYQLNVRTLMPVGEGPQELALRKLKERLEKEGLFDASRKRALPRFPKRVAVITSPTGAAIRDFLHVLRPRWSDLKILLVPARVQGDGAAEEIALAFETISQFRIQPDVVVLTRGGGSPEDLACFNEEVVCRAMARCSVPVICGVGHESDVTLADFVADIRALTPSDAALRIAPDRVELRNQLSELTLRLVGRLKTKYQQSAQALESLLERPVLSQPVARFRHLEMELDRTGQHLDRSIRFQVREQEQILKAVSGRLTAINPAAVLARGYSLTCDENGKLILDSQEVQKGMWIKTKLATGSITSRVEEVDGAGRNGSVSTT
jgi:exodeoxyribonuclease VII large subunit